MYAKRKILNKFNYMLFSLTIGGVFWIAVFAHLAYKAVQIEYKQFFLIIGLLFGVAIVYGYLKELIGLHRKLLLEKQNTTKREISYINNAYRKIASINPADYEIRSGQIKSFLGVLLHALNAGITVQDINKFLEGKKCGMHLATFFDLDSDLKNPSGRISFEHNTIKETIAEIVLF